MKNTHEFSSILELISTKRQVIMNTSLDQFLDWMMIDGKPLTEAEKKKYTYQIKEIERIEKLGRGLLFPVRRRSINPVRYAKRANDHFSSEDSYFSAGSV